MNSSWAAVVLGSLVAAGGGGAALGRWFAGRIRHEAKIDAAIEQLTAITANHEDRLNRGGL